MMRQEDIRTLLGWLQQDRADTIGYFATALRMDEASRRHRGEAPHDAVMEEGNRLQVLSDLLGHPPAVAPTPPTPVARRRR